MRLHLPGLFLTSLATLAVSACGGEDLVLPPGTAPSDGEAARIEMVDGNNQQGAPGTPLGAPVIVQLVDQAGNGIPNEPISWVVATGNGNATPQTTMTNGDGVASAIWTLGEPGPNSLSAVASGVDAVTFSAMANPTDDGGGNGGGGSDVTPNAGTSTVSADPTVIQVGSGTSTIRVTVRNAAGAPIPGAVVTLSVTGSGNTLTQPAGPTGADGVATGTLSSTVPGTKDVTATVNGTVQLNQTAQVTVAIAPPTRIELVEGNNQRAESGAEVPVRPAVRVTDASGRPVVGYGVTFVATRGGGTVTGASQTTNSEGIARVGGWTLGSPGQNTLEARAGALNGSPVIFQAEATSAPPPPPPPPPPPSAKPHHFIFLEPPRDVREDKDFTVKVAIVDVNGNIVRLSGIEIYLGLFRQGQEEPSNSRLLGDRFRDTKDGVAEFKLRITNGNFGVATGTTETGYRLRALSDELPELGPYGPTPYLYSQPFDVLGR